MNSPEDQPTSPRPATQVRLERTGLGRYVATNSRGVSIDLGHGDDLFSPVELLLAAVAGCSAIDVDYIASKRAEPESFVAQASGTKGTDEAGGHHLDSVAVDFSLLFPETPEGQEAAAVVERAVRQSRDRLCTVSRTVARQTPVSFSVGGEDLA